MAQLLRRCLAKDRDERQQSALDLANELGWIAESIERPTRGRHPPTSASDYRIEYFKSSDGTSIAAARGGSGMPLFVVPSMVDTIEGSWARFAGIFGEREVVTYDRRGTGLSQRGCHTDDPQPYMPDAEAVVRGFALDPFDVLGTLLGTIEAAWIASRFASRVKRLVMRSPTVGLGDWGSIPGVRAALAALEHDWDYFTESFAQFVIGWGHPNARELAAKYRAITSPEELRSLLEALMKLDLIPVYAGVEASTLVEHHPGYFFPDEYSRRVASMIPRCPLGVFSGPDNEFLGDFEIARTFMNNE